MKKVLKGDQVSVKTGTSSISGCTPEHILILDLNFIECFRDQMFSGKTIIFLKKENYVDEKNFIY